MHSVTPQVNIGQESTGFYSDSYRTAFIKYNNHRHWDSVTNNFLFENISVGDPVRLINKRGIDVFVHTPPNINPVITAITPSQIICSVSATEDASHVPLLLPNNRLVEYVSITKNSNTITRQSLSGMLSPTNKEILLTEELRGNWILPLNTLSQPLSLILINSSQLTYRIAKLIVLPNRIPNLTSHNLEVSLKANTIQLIPTLISTLNELSTVNFSSAQPLLQPNQSLSLLVNFNQGLLGFSYTVVLYKLI